MSSDDLIERMVAEIRPSHRRAFGVPGLLLAGVSVAVAISIGLSYAFLTPVEWSAQRLIDPVFMLKMAFLLSVFFISLSVVRDLSSPGRKVALQLVVALVPFLVLGLLSYREIQVSHIQSLHHELVHQSLMSCLWQVGLLALPAFAVLVATVRLLAPVNLSRAGFYVGVLSGCIGAMGYAIHCHEQFITLVTLSYTLAIVQMGMIGALLGPRLLRWA